MNTKRVFGIFLGLTVLVLLGLTARAALPRPEGTALAEAPRSMLQVAGARTEAALSHAVMARAEVSELVTGATMTQDFTLQPGWNAIYLGVEPLNGSPLGADGAPTLSVMEWVFQALAESDALESVWTYTQPVSSKDFIIDPNEGLWDEPGWERYVPVQMIGADGKSQGFLSNLYTLHADTGYLVKLRDDLGAPVTLSITGRPVVSHHRWELDVWNLTGFPLPPAGGATVGAMKAASSITDMRGLTTAGAWTKLTDDVALQYGQSYLVFYGDPGEGRTNFTAPLEVQEIAGRGLTFQAGYQGSRQTFELENLTGTAMTVNLALKTGSLVVKQVTGMPGSEVLTQLPVNLDIAAHWAEPIVLQVSSSGLTGPVEDLLQISSTAPGVRWLVPIAAKPGSYDGLWVGEVVVNNVSEARLGATGVSDLTVSLSQQNASGVRGAAELHEKTIGPTTSVDITVTLELPLPDPAPIRAIQGTTPYVGGYVFLDENLNGQRDATERGLSGVTVTLGGQTQTTADDGSYVFSSVSAGLYNISTNLGTGYTSGFHVILPDDVEPVTPVANVLPTSVTVAATGISGVAPAEYLVQVLPEPYTTLPYADATGAPVQPDINFGYAIAHTVTLNAGTCASPGSNIATGTAINGRLVKTLSPQTLAALTGHAHIAVERLGQMVACGDLLVGAPTKFADGGGSEFRFRLLLRVDANGVVDLLPHYIFANTDDKAAFPRLSSPALSIADAIAGSGNFIAGNEIRFLVDIASQDPLNPFKHKYHPDHDNLDAKFEPFDPTQLSPYYWESFGVKRTIALTLKNDPAFEGMTAEEIERLSGELDWGGENWGGDYAEVIEGLHQNDITVKGYFVIHHALAGDALTKQDYDK